MVRHMDGRILSWKGIKNLNQITHFYRLIVLFQYCSYAAPVAPAGAVIV